MTDRNKIIVLKQALKQSQQNHHRQMLWEKHKNGNSGHYGSSFRQCPSHSCRWADEAICAVEGRRAKSMNDILEAIQKKRNNPVIDLGNF